MTERQALAQGFAELGLAANPQTVDNFLRFSEMLLETNKVMNLTAVTAPMEVVTRHFLDCAAAMQQLRLTDESIVDVGCGAGFPGMPTALLYPQAQVTLLDSLGKRIRFLQECITALQLPQTQAIHARAEEFAAKHREQYDIVTSRAVARMNVLCELSLPLVKVGGRFAAMKSTNCDAELAEAKKAISVLGGEVECVQDYTIPLTEMRQRMIIIRKKKETPQKYPRRFQKIAAVPLS